MAPHSLRTYYVTEEARRRRSTTPSYLKEDYGLSHSRLPDEKKAFFNSIGLRMKRVRYDKFFDYEIEEQPTEVAPAKTKANIPAGIHLRECSVVIQGEWCKFCGREFKCSTDAVAHIKMRHAIHKDSTSSDVYSDLSSGNDTDVSRTKSPLLRNTNVQAKKERRKRMRLVLKMGKEIMGDHFIKRKHLKSTSSTGPAQRCEFTEMETMDYEHADEDSGVSSCEHTINNSSSFNSEVESLHHPENHNLETTRKAFGTSENAMVLINSPVSLPKMKSEEVHRLSDAADTMCGMIPRDCSTPKNSNSKILSSAMQENVIVKKVSDIKNEEIRTSHSLSKPPVSTNHQMTADSESTTRVQNSMAINSTSQGKYPDLSITRVNNRPNDTSKNHANAAVTKQSVITSSSRVQNSVPTTNSETAKILRRLTSNGSTVIRPNVIVRPVSVIQSASRTTQPPSDGHPTASVSIQVPKPLESEAQSPKESHKFTTSSTQHSLLQFAMECEPQMVSGYNTIPITTERDQDSSDDDIQEVLRINRGQQMLGSKAINHESPNRSEREILQVGDAINDMIRMEEQGLHLLAAKKNAKKNKKRVSNEMDLNGKTMKSPQQEKIHRNASGVPKVPNPQKPERGNAQSSNSEMLKENVPTESNKGSLRVLQNYYANYHNESAGLLSDRSATSYNSHNSGRVVENNGNKTVILVDLVDD